MHASKFQMKCTAMNMLPHENRRRTGVQYCHNPITCRTARSPTCHAIRDGRPRQVLHTIPPMRRCPCERQPSTPVFCRRCRRGPPGYETVSQADARRMGRLRPTVLFCMMPSLSPLGTKTVLAYAKTLTDLHFRH